MTTPKKAKDKEDEAEENSDLCPNCGFNLKEHKKLVKEHHGIDLDKSETEDAG